jgi:hypothetical protein
LLENKPVYYSVDLTAATDRLPISFQKKVLEAITSSSYATAWEQLLVDTPFTVKDLSLYYKAGQPMGAYSS